MWLGLRPFCRSKLETDFLGVKTVFNWSIWFRFFIRCKRFRKISLLLYSRSLLRNFFFRHDSPRLANDIETIKCDGVCDPGIGEEVTTIESKVCFWDKRCFCTLVFTASLRSFNSSWKVPWFCCIVVFVFSVVSRGILMPPSFSSVLVFCVPWCSFLLFLWKEFGKMYKSCFN